MSELREILIGDGFAAPPSHIIEALPAELAHRRIPGLPHTIYEELWHLAFWQQLSLEWVEGRETPFPETPSNGFPTQEECERESWPPLCARFIDAVQRTAALADDTANLDREIRCPSRPGSPVRLMTARDQLENLAAHNAYHLGRIVVLRQLCGSWPPPSGGFSW
jgi:uncharacterized damage-inducible protein DinB